MSNEGGLIYIVIGILVFVALLRNIGTIMLGLGFCVAVLGCLYGGIILFKNLLPEKANIVVKEVDNKSCDNVFTFGDNIYKTVSETLTEKSKQTVEKIKEFK